MRTLYALTGCALLVGLTATVPVFAQQFPDVPLGHWAYDALAQLAAAGLVEGYPDRSFKGDRPMTRYEMAMVVERALNKIRQIEQRAEQAMKTAQLRELPPPSPEVKREDIARIERLIAEFKPELAQLGVRIAAIEEDLKRLKQDVAQLGRIRFSGYAKLDIIAGSTLTRSDAPGPGGIPVSTAPESRTGEFRLGARQSRIGLTYRDAIGGSRVTAFIQGDFFGTAGSALVTQGHGFRIRHAMARIDFPSGLYLLGGQFWTTFMTLEAYPDTVDFNGPTGALFSRQPQLRLGWPLGRGSAVELAVENHSLQSITTVGATAVRQDEALPQGVARVFWKSDSLFVEIAGTLGQSRFLFASGNSPSVSNSGYHISARWDIGQFYLMGHYQVLNGVNRFSNGEFPDILVNTATEAITNIASRGYYVYGGVKLSPKWTFQLGYSRNDLSAPGSLTGVASSVDSALQAGHATLWWDPLPNYGVGFEYQDIKRTRLDGVSGDHNRFQIGIFMFF